MLNKQLTNYEKYQALPEATDEQFNAARDEAKLWMSEGGGMVNYSSSKSLAKLAVVEYILFKQGLRVKRSF